MLCHIGVVGSPPTLQFGLWVDCHSAFGVALGSLGPLPCSMGLFGPPPDWHLILHWALGSPPMLHWGPWVASQAELGSWGCVPLFILHCTKVSGDAEWEGIHIVSSHLFEHAEWSWNNFGKSLFWLLLDPPVHPVTLPWHACGAKKALKGVDCVELHCKQSLHHCLSPQGSPTQPMAFKCNTGGKYFEKSCKKGAFQGSFFGILGPKRGHWGL